EDALERAPPFARPLPALGVVGPAHAFAERDPPAQVLAEQLGLLREARAMDPVRLGPDHPRRRLARALDAGQLDLLDGRTGAGEHLGGGADAAQHLRFEVIEEEVAR